MTCAETLRKTVGNKIRSGTQTKGPQTCNSDGASDSCRCADRAPGNPCLAAHCRFSPPARRAPISASATPRRAWSASAIGYRAKAGWVTEGWWHVDGSTCKTLIEGPLSSRYYYLYAEDAERGGRWDGPVNMCVAEKEFKIAGVNDCFARGFQRAGFQEYDTGEQASWMVQLTDEPATDGTAAVNGTDGQ